MSWGVVSVATKALMFEASTRDEAVSAALEFDSLGAAPMSVVRMPHVDLSPGLGNPMAWLWAPPQGGTERLAG